MRTKAVVRVRRVRHVDWVDWFNNRRPLYTIGNISPAEAEEWLRATAAALTHRLRSWWDKQYYAMMDQPPMAA